MPRGRPRKGVPASPPGPDFVQDGCASPSSSTDQPSITGGRPARNRIAVRRFGTAADQEYHEAAVAASSSGGQRQPGNDSGYVLIHKSFWNDMCAKLACSSCRKKSVQMKTEKLSGVANKLIIYCTACGVVLSQVTSSEEAEVENSDPEELDFEVNRRFVSFFINEGKTYDDVVVFSKTLGIPVISRCMFEKYCNELQAAGN